MERLQHVLGRRAGDLVTLLVDRRGFSDDEAARFVAVAGADLIESYHWQGEDIEPGDLTSTPNVQKLLGGIHANSIATNLGVPPSEVWETLRVFVPRVLEWTNGRADSGNGAGSLGDGSGLLCNGTGPHRTNRLRSPGASRAGLRIRRRAEPQSIRS